MLAEHSAMPLVRLSRNRASLTLRLSPALSAGGPPGSTEENKASGQIKEATAGIKGPASLRKCTLNSGMALALISIGATPNYVGTYLMLARGKLAVAFAGAFFAWAGRIILTSIAVQTAIAAAALVVCLMGTTGR